MAIWGKSRKVIEWPPANSSYDGYTLPDLSSQRLQPKSLRNVVAVAAGEDHSLALTKAGKVCIACTASTAYVCVCVCVCVACVRVHVCKCWFVASRLSGCRASSR